MTVLSKTMVTEDQSFPKNDKVLIISGMNDVLNDANFTYFLISYWHNLNSDHVCYTRNHAVLSVVLLCNTAQTAAIRSALEIVNNSLWAENRTSATVLLIRITCLVG